MKTPICLLQWLNDNEYRETHDALISFAKDIGISHYDVKLKDEAYKALIEWFTNNSNSQYLFIGAHGIQDSQGKCLGIGRSINDYVQWNELWKWLGEANHPPVLWLGACKSSHAAEAWSPFPSRPISASWIVGFEKDIYPIEVKNILLDLMKTTSINRIIHVDQELDFLRSSFPSTSVRLYFPAHKLNGCDAFVDVDKFQEEVGVSFKEFLLNQK